MKNNKTYQNSGRSYCKQTQDVPNEIMDLGNDHQWQPRPKVKAKGELYNGWMRVTTLKPIDKC